MTTIARLPAEFPSRYGAPVIARVDTSIFQLTYFTACLACSYCEDWCCRHGVDVDLHHYRSIVGHADAIEAFTGIPRARWFTDDYEADPGVPGGGTRRTAVENGGCVFLNREGRGCLLHRFGIEHGIDYRELKSLADCLFPLSFYDGTLCASDEAADGSLVCVDTGPTLYRGQRGELAYYFGDAFVAALDRLEARVRDR